jgi:hypothetical protein
LLSSWKYRTFRETLGYSRGGGGGVGFDSNIYPSKMSRKFFCYRFRCLL